MTYLSRDNKSRRAAEILSNPDLKQRLCNQSAGLSHKDIENALKDLAASASVEEVETDIDSYDFTPAQKTRPRKKQELRPLLDRDEINNLIEASLVPFEQEHAPDAPCNYPTYSLEEVIVLLGINLAVPKTKQKE